MGIDVYAGRGSPTAKSAVKHSARRYGTPEQPKCAEVHFNNTGKKRRADGSDYREDADFDYNRNIKMVPPAGKISRP